MVIIFSFFLILINCELKYVVEVFRHGAREKVYERVPYSGELTSVGQRQHFLLGDQLRKEYIIEKKFLSPQFDSDEFKVYSTDYNRTLQSAISQLDGLYPLGSGKRLTKNQDMIAKPEFNNITYDTNKLRSAALPNFYQPIPIHLDSDHKIDHFFNKTYVSQIKEILQNGDFFKMVHNDMKPTFDAYQLRSGRPWNKSQEGMRQISNEMDNIMCDYYKGLGYPEYMVNNPELHRNMSFIYNIMSFLELYGETQYTFWFTDTLFYLMQDYAKQTQLYDDNNKFKWLMISAHDTTIQALLGSMNMTSRECMYRQFQQPDVEVPNCVYKFPFFTSNLIFEHYQENDRKFIKVRYNGNYMNLCEKNEIECDYEEFYSRINYGCDHAFLKINY